MAGETATYLLQHVNQGEVVSSETITCTATALEQYVKDLAGEVIARDDARFEGPGTWLSGSISWERLG